MTLGDLRKLSLPDETPVIVVDRTGNPFEKHTNLVWVEDVMKTEDRFQDVLVIILAR